MADELNQNAEFGGKHTDEEDPLLVAQRYLNIYHQIHIFNDARKQEFDDSLLALPSDIRILLSTLPGGSVLLEHINEIEEQRGIVSYTDILTPSKKSTSKRGKASKESAEDNDDEDVEEKGTKRSNKQAGNINISNNVLKMLKQSEEKHDKDMKALTSAFLQSQENMANILKEVLLTSKTQPNPPYPTSPFVPNTAQDVLVQNASYPIQPQMPEQTSPVSEQESTSVKPKLFSFTRKLFSHKTSATPQEQAPALNPYVDNTPVSLDDITDAPITLGEDVDTLESISEQQTIAPEVTQIPSQETPSDTAVNNDDSEWDWEYVDEDDTSGNNDSDDEWEYVEEPVDEIDENQVQQATPSAEQSDDEWEYVEEPVEETNETQVLQDTSSDVLGDDEWEYVEEPVSTENTTEISDSNINTTFDTAENTSELSQDIQPETASIEQFADEETPSEDENQLLSNDISDSESFDYPEDSFTEDDNLLAETFAESKKDEALYNAFDEHQTAGFSNAQFDENYEQNDAQTSEEYPQNQDDPFETDENSETTPQFEYADQAYSTEDNKDEAQTDALSDMNNSSNEMDQLFEQFLSANNDSDEKNFDSNEILSEENDTVDTFLEKDNDLAKADTDETQNTEKTKKKRRRNKNKTEQEE
ncbi:MAG TPA: hypothetical protein DIC64_01775 [Alphaproteobacteria bacterium]|nr:hypothetical protein [Alphaproteobacteria bacterium]